MKDKLIIELFNKKCIQFGEFTLKDGSKSPIYIDLKNIISFPYILNSILTLLYEKIQLLEFNRLLGVPYGGLVLSSALCSKYSLPMILVRKETKKYGLKKAIEGVYEPKDICLVLEDTISTGSSALDFINKIKKYELIVNDIIVICDRRKDSKYDFGGRCIHSIFTINDVMNTLYKTKSIDTKTYDTIKTHFSNIKFDTYAPDFKNGNLKHILSNKNNLKTQYCFDANFKDFTKIIELVLFYKYKICILKIYTDIIENLTLDNIGILKKFSVQYNFLIMDGKLFDYNETRFFYQYTGKFKLNEWINLIELSDLHSEKIMNVIDQINKNVKQVSIIYKNHYINNNKLLWTLNKYKNIIGINGSKIDCNILILDTKKTKNKNATITILEKEDYYKYSKFVSI